MAGIKDSNAIGLTDIINREAVRADKMADLESLDISVIPPSDYKEINKLLFDDDASTITARSEESSEHYVSESGSVTGDDEVS